MPQQGKWTFAQGLQVFFVRRVLEKYTRTALVGDRLGDEFFGAWSDIVAADENAPRTVAVPEWFLQKAVESAEPGQGSITLTAAAEAKRAAAAVSFAPPAYHNILDNLRFRGLLHLLKDKDLGNLMRIRYPADTSGIALPTERSAQEGIQRAIEAAEKSGQIPDRKSEDYRAIIPAGVFWMGAQKKEPRGRNYDPQARSSAESQETHEEPVHEVTLSAYRIGRCPVTVGEYALFVRDGGYAKKRFWTAGGFGSQQAPHGWDEQLTHPTRPMVYVSWFEASAYAAWTGCRLPTEAEWERAARGLDGRRFPWGHEEPNPELANYGGSVGSPTPVGVYRRGATPEGVLDLAGNVWEWCGDWYGPYSADSQVDPSGPSSGKGRVLRGGSWFNNDRNLRCAYRNWNRPEIRLDYMGFRLAAGT